jgi:hypothetical protein
MIPRLPISAGFALVQKAGGGTFNKEECVFDTVSGLTWEGKTSNGGLRDRALAYTNFGDRRLGDASGYVDYVNSIALCGIQSWRIPAVDELQGLYNYSVSLPFDSSWFPNSTTNTHWAFGAAYLTGEGSSYSGTQYTFPLQLVSGLRVPDAQRFSYSVDGVEVTDSRTGLVWMRCVVGATWNGVNCVGTPILMNHEAALQYAESQALMRLPNVKELFSIVDPINVRQAFYVGAFPGTPADWHWSSTPHQFGVQAWMASFATGWLNYYNNYGSSGTPRDRQMAYVRLLKAR